MHTTLPENGFAQLDGTIIRAADREWRLAVFSAHVESARRWMQVNVTSGTDTVALLLSLSLDIEPDATLDAIKRWLNAPSRHDSRVIEIN